METRSLTKAVLATLILLASMLIIGLKIKVSTDLSLFLPEPSSKVERLLHYQLDNGASTNMVFIALSGLSPEQLVQSNQQLTDALGTSTIFRKVVNSTSELSDKALNFVVDNRYLLSHRDLGEIFTVEGLRDMLSERLRGLASSQAGLEKRFLRKDPSGEVLVLLENWQGKLSKHKKPEEFQRLWFSKDHQRSLILAEIDAKVTRLEVQIRAIQAIRVAFEKIRRPGLELTLTGPAAFAVESGEDIREDIRLLTWLALIFVTLFLFLVYRSVPMLVLVFAPLVAGIITATAGILLFYGQIHGITLAFGITLAGVAVDYPIHLLTGLVRNGNKDMAYVKKIWPTLRLGVLSTMAAYATFLVSGFSGLRQLGLFTIIGLLTAALFSRWVLPLLIWNQSDRPHGLQGFHKLLSRLARKASRVRPLVLVVGVSAFALMFVTDSPVLHLDVDSLSPINDSRRAEGKLLRADLGYWYGGSMMIITAPDKNAVLQKSELIEPYLDQLIADQHLTGYDMAAQFLPSKQRQQQNLGALKDISSIGQKLTEALVDTPFKPGVFDPFLSDLELLAQRQPIEVEEFLQRDIGKRLAPLLFNFEQEAGGVVLLHGVKDAGTLNRFANEHDGVIYMHLKTSATDLVARSVSRISVIMLGCILAIYLLLAYAFKSIWRPFKIMVPTFSAAVVTAALLVAFGNPLSVFHLISLMLVVGLGLDYALFFNRLPGNSDEWNTTFNSLWVCGVTTILVFGILVVSQTPPLKAIGLTVGIGAFLSFLFAAMWATRGENSSPAVHRN